MTDKTPEQTLRGLLAMGEKATEFPDLALTPDQKHDLAYKALDALPAIRSLIEEVEAKAARLSAYEGAVERFVGVAEQCAKIVDRNLYHQREKVQDVTGLLLTEVARLRALQEK